MDYRNLDIRKLKALLTTADGERRAAIIRELERRDPEAARAARADEPDGAVDVAARIRARPYTPKGPKLTDAERRELARACAANKGHLCQVVPYNSDGWADGVVTGVHEDKKTNRVLYSVRTADGRRVFKGVNSQQIRVFDQLAPRTSIGRRLREAAGMGDWTDEDIRRELDALTPDVGKEVEFDLPGGNPVTGPDTVRGRIVSLTVDRKIQRVQYRIASADPYTGRTRFYHKVVGGRGLRLAESLDAEGSFINARYVSRRANAARQVKATPQGRVMACEENLLRARGSLRRAEENLKEKERQLADAKAELGGFLDDII